MTIISKVQVFLKEVYVELRKVNWLSTREVLRYTIIVVGVTIIVASFLGGLDFLFSHAIQKFVVK